jgi:hypothetical protein
MAAVFKAMAAEINGLQGSSLQQNQGMVYKGN